MQCSKTNNGMAVRAGVIGSGAYGKGTVGQFPRVAGLEVPIIAESNLDEAREADHLAGLGPDVVVQCDDRGKALGLVPDVPRLHSPPLYACEVPRLLCEQKDGGLLGGNGRFDTVVYMRMAHEGGRAAGCSSAWTAFANTPGATSRKAPSRLKATPFR